MDNAVLNRILDVQDTALSDRAPQPPALGAKITGAPIGAP